MAIWSSLSTDLKNSRCFATLIILLTNPSATLNTSVGLVGKCFSFVWVFERNEELSWALFISSRTSLSASCMFTNRSSRVSVDSSHDWGTFWLSVNPTQLRLSEQSSDFILLSVFISSSVRPGNWSFRDSADWERIFWRYALLISDSETEYVSSGGSEPWRRNLLMIIFCFRTFFCSSSVKKKESMYINVKI